MGEKNIVTIKGLEGGTDLPISRACITARTQKNQLKRLILHPRDHNYSGTELKWQNIVVWRNHALNALENKGPLKQALIWNAGIYLWIAEITNNVQEGIKKAKDLLSSGAAKGKLNQLIEWRKSLDL